jgi:hypothetical protein
MVTTRSSSSSKAKGLSRPQPPLYSNDEPPLYTIDLSLPPKQRYTRICADYKHKLSALTSLYDETLTFLGVPWIGRVLLNNLILRRVHCAEETEEIRAIARAVKVPVHLVVAYNTLLDLFSGCISAGVRVRDAGEGRDKSSIVHLRGLDWDMEPLRELIINVEYVRGGNVVARAVTYAGYTGVLTGVREGLSISFNYRACIASSSSILKRRIHQLLMLTGFRRSVPSHLRHILLSPDPPQTTLHDIRQWLTHPATRLSSCYLTFCSPSAVLVVERDLAKATVRTSESYLVVTNHDEDMEGMALDDRKRLLREQGYDDGLVNDIVVDSVERKDSLLELVRGSEFRGKPRRTMADVKEWLETDPVKNEMTHYSCIMDPSVRGGGLVWVQRYPFVPRDDDESFSA